ncbi:lysophospholipid acyltransferase [Haplosporangium sp. Z 27]|nr:lysophospholipid acyltransferase [Haplosporangium sp. Z 27]
MLDSFFNAFSEAASFPADQLRCLTCLLIAYPLAYAFWLLPTNNSNIKHTVSVLTSFFLFVVVMDDMVGLTHLLGSSIAVWRIMGSVKGKWGPRIVFIGVMLHMSVSHLMRQLNDYRGSKLDHTGPQMILTMKLTSWAFSVYDGRRNPKISTRRFPESLIISKDRESSRTLTTSQNQVTVPINSSDNSHTPKLKSLPGRAEAIMNLFIPEKLPNTLGGKYSVMMLMITCFLALTGIMGATLQISPYLLYRFHFPSEKLGFVGAVQGLSRLAALSLLLPLVKRLAPQTSVSNPALTISFDLKVVVGGLLIEALSMFIYAVTPIGEGFYLGGVTGAVGSLFFPAIRGILSQAVASELLGKTLGTVAIFESVSSAFSPLLFAWIYGISLESHPSAMFYFATIVALSSAGLALAVLVAHRRDLHHRA